MVARTLSRQISWEWSAHKWSRTWEPPSKGTLRGRTEGDPAVQISSLFSKSSCVRWLGQVGMESWSSGHAWPLQKLTAVSSLWFLVLLWSGHRFHPSIFFSLSVHPQAALISFIMTSFTVTTCGSLTHHHCSAHPNYIYILSIKQTPLSETTHNYNGTTVWAIEG